MKHNRRESVKIFLLLIVLLTVIAGCSSNSNKTETNDESQTNASASDANDATEYPIVIEHAFGKTEIESKPERVVTIQWGNQDVALALGVVPVGFSEANFGVQDDSGILPWTSEKLDELGVTDPNVFQDTDGLDFEAISDAQPDVILAAYSGITQEDYDLLNEIAPVVAFPTSPWTTTWREQVLYNAKGMGMEEEGEQLIKDVEETIAEKIKDYPEIEGKKVVWVNFSAKDTSQLHIYTPTDSRGAFLYELGLEYPQSIIDMSDDSDGYSLKLSAENAGALNDADIIVGYGNDELLEVLQEDPLLGEIPAIERGSVAFIDSDTPLVAAGTPTPLSITYTIDEYLELIGGAIEKLNE